MNRTLLTAATIAGTAAFTLGSQAAPLQIDFSTGASSTVASPALTDWETISGTGSPSGTFSGYTDLAVSDITVSLSNVAYDRLYKNGFTGAADDFPGTDLDVMYSDMLFRNNNAATLDVTISGLKAGTFQITVHSLLQLQGPTPGTFDLNVQDADSPAFGQSVGTFTQGDGSTSSFDPNVITFDVLSNGSDDIILQMVQGTPSSGGNTGGWFGYSGMEIAVPEPSSLALLGLGGLLVARRRRG